MDERAAFLARRRRGLGGTDAAAIVGLNPYRTPIDVWLDKRGLSEPMPETEPMWWGLALEALIRRRYEELTGRRVELRPDGVVHLEHSCLIGSPDGIIAGEDRGFEIKTTAAHNAYQWGDGEDEIPTQHAVQCMHYMMVTGLPRWDLGVLIGGSDFRIYELQADPALISWLRHRLLDWWERHIVGEEEPDIDGSMAARAYIHHRFPADRGEILPAPTQAVVVGRTLAAVRRWQDHLASTRNFCETTLKAMLADNAGFDSAEWRATWKLTKPRRDVDWEAVAKELGASTAHDDWYAEVVARHTSDKPGVRRFLFTDRSSAAPLAPELGPLGQAILAFANGGSDGE